MTIVQALVMAGLLVGYIDVHFTVIFSRYTQPIFTKVAQDISHRTTVSPIVNLRLISILQIFTEIKHKLLLTDLPSID